MNIFQYPNQNQTLIDNIEAQRRLNMKQAEFYAANTSNKKIIAYGDYNSKRLFKVTYQNSMYFTWKMRKGSYSYIGESTSLDSAIDKCNLTIN